MTTLSIDEFPEEMYHSTRCFHTCGITLALNEQVRETAVEMMRRFKEAGALISFVLKRSFLLSIFSSVLTAPPA